MNFQNLIDYGQGFDIDVLGGVPNIPPLSTETLKSHIVFKCGLLTPLYSEPETLRDAISHWFSYMKFDIDKMIAVASTQYLPLENYRRVETEQRSEATSGTNDTTTTDSGTIGDVMAGTTENEVSAYNSSDYEDDRKQTLDQTNDRTIDTERRSDNDYTRQENESINRKVYGNIGTMTSQDMFNQELDLLERFNPYEWIVSKIEKELFLGLW